ncbi:MAG: holliday junction helicase RuvA [Patescibacteria group bacterium]|nr:holliday junction helicase RuvA [Patescibacteria group bacterium]
MINTLKGQIADIDDRSITLNVGDIGYEVLLPLSYLLQLKSGDIVNVFIHTHVREDQFTLFGFENKAEKDLFRKLINVSGIGPRSALAMLSVATVQNIVRAIESGEVNNFPKIPGVGKKTLEKLIVELRGKFDNIIITNESDDIKNARLALETLGYNSRDISTVLSTLHPDLDMNSIIREALKVLSKA